MTRQLSIPDYSELIDQSLLILSSYEHWFKKPLLKFNTSSSLQIAQELFEAPIVVLSAEKTKNPLLNYGNLKALTLWEMNWQELISTRGKDTAEISEQEQRSSFLSQVQKTGYIDHYEGVRISKSGKRFLIQNVQVWKLVDASNQDCGQAATFKDWVYL